MGIVLAVLAPASSPARAGQPREVYYQVRYANRQVRDLADVPKTNKGIRMVVRISRFDTGSKGYEVYSTGPVPLTLVNTGRTVRSELKWDGKAWVAAEDVRKERTSAQAVDAGKTTKDSERAGIRRFLAAEIQKHRRRLADLEKAVTEATERVAKAQDDDAKAAGRSRLKEAMKVRRQCRRTIEVHERLLVAVEKGGPKPPVPTGSVQAAKPPEKEKNVSGVVEPIDEKGILPHRVQVWRLPAASGRRTYCVSMAHAEAGTFGGFFYVAYADTDGDGLPDKLIARSPPAQAIRPGGWTRWHFTTDQKHVFVGNGWEHADTTVYRRTGRRDDNWRGLSTEVYVSGLPWLLPRRRHGMWPFLTNIRVRVADQNPDHPAEAGSTVIIRQRD